MATTYVQRSDTSDLSGGGTYSRQLVQGTAAVSDLVIALAASETKTGHSFTASGVPGTAGVTGDYTVEVDIAIGDTSVMISVAVGRVNSAGTIQTESSFTAEQVAAGAVLTFNLTSVNLGTWAAGDRLRVAVRYRNSHTHTGRNVTVSFNTDESEVIAPWTSGSPATVTPAAIAPTVSLPASVPSIPATVTPAAIAWGAGTPGFVALSGSSGYISTPDHASLDITGDIDIRALVALDDWTPTAGTVLNFVTKWGAAAGTLAYYLALGGDGTEADKLRFQWRKSGDVDTVQTFSTVAPSVSNGSHLWVRATLDVDDGVEAIVKFYTSADPINTDPASVSWSQLGAQIELGVTTSIFSANEIVELGSRDTGASGLWPGKFYYAEIRNGIDGTIVANPDFRDDDQVTTPNTVFTDTQGRVWTINSPASWTADGPGGLSLPTPTIVISNPPTAVTPAAVAPTVSLPGPAPLAASKVTPVAVAPTLSLPNPTATGAARVLPGAVAPTTSLPLATAQGQARTTPAALAPTVSLPTSTLSAGARVTPNALAPAVSLPIPTAGAGATPTTVTPAAISLSVSLPLAALLAAAKVTPGAVGPTLSLPLATLLAGARVTPAAVAPTLSLPLATAQGQARVAPTAVGPVLSLPLVTLSAGARVTPSALVPTFSLPIPVVIAGAGTTVAPGAISLSFSFPTPTPTGLARVTPTAITLAVSLPNPTAGIAAQVAPGAISLSVVAPAPTILAGATVAPAAVALLVALPASSLSAGAVVTPAAVALVFSLPGPTAVLGIVPFWTRVPIQYTRAPIAFTRVGGEDDPPW